MDDLILVHGKGLPQDLRVLYLVPSLACPPQMTPDSSSGLLSIVAAGIFAPEENEEDGSVTEA